ncbi:uncharacterized protein LOC123258927 [Cotesia glomerata]|uniref:uncharacterized protein LOC123258927 n=1 Tax=Cotesia glomerata TaxID=32391 RepID=UPI001D03097E|nr:uncharacterized protein LOC123258927 [Cotesia glomerata]
MDVSVGPSAHEYASSTDSNRIDRAEFQAVQQSKEARIKRRLEKNRLKASTMLKDVCCIELELMILYNFRPSYSEHRKLFFFQDVLGEALSRANGLIFLHEKFTEHRYSFANVMYPDGARHFPPLPRAKSRPVGLSFVHVIDSPPEPTTGNASNSNISRMEELLISFKNDITTEFRKINDRISTNTTRIDQIMAALFSDDE